MSSAHGQRQTPAFFDPLRDYGDVDADLTTIEEWAATNSVAKVDGTFRLGDVAFARSKAGLPRSMSCRALWAVRAELESRHSQRRDLRRTGIVRLAEAGATTPQIAAVSGHSIDYCQRIIDTYLPRRTEVALGGILAWERAGAVAENVVQIWKGRA